MAAVSSMSKMYGLCFRAVRQTAGLKAYRLLQRRGFRVTVSENSHALFGLSNE